MQLSPLSIRLALVVPVISLFTLAPLRADDNVDYHPALEEIHGLLKQAMGGDSGSPPDKTFTHTPAAASRFKAWSALSFGGSAKVRKPSKIRPASSPGASASPGVAAHNWYAR